MRLRAAFMLKFMLLLSWDRHQLVHGVVAAGIQAWKGISFPIRPYVMGWEVASYW